MGQLKSIKYPLGTMRHQVYDLQEQWKYCSALESLQCEPHRMGYKGVGVRTACKLEEAGFGRLEALRQEKLVGLDKISGFLGLPNSV